MQTVLSVKSWPIPKSIWPWNNYYVEPRKPTSEMNLYQLALIHCINILSWRNTFFRCDKCDYSSLRKGNLTKHSASVHGDTKTHSCLECEEVFPTKAELVSHVKGRYSVLPWDSPHWRDINCTDVWFMLSMCICCLAEKACFLK